MNPTKSTPAATEIAGRLVTVTKLLEQYRQSKAAKSAR